MKRLTLATLATLSVSAFAQPTYITQIQESETWIKGGYATSTRDSDLTRKSDQLTASESSEADGYGVTILKMMKSSTGVTPGIFFSGSAIGDDDTDLTIIDVGGVARLDLASLPAALSVGYSATSKSEYRDAITLSFDLGSNSQNSSFYNQISMEYQSFIEANGVAGANPLSILNTSIFQISPKVDAVTQVGLTIRSDVSIDGVKTREYGNELTFGVGLDMHISLANTIQVTLVKSNGTNDRFGNGQVVEYDNRDTTINLNIIGRF